MVGPEGLESARGPLPPADYEELGDSRTWVVRRRIVTGFSDGKGQDNRN